MILFHPPTQDAIAAFLTRQKDAELTYADIGATAGDPPEKYVIDRTRRRLGSGVDAYEAAVGAMRTWKQFDLGWVQIVAPQEPFAAGDDVAIVAHVFGVWWLNACRIVYVEEDRGGATRRFAFAYGTLPDHAGEGEERFSVALEADGSVFFEVSAFSRPRHVLSRMAYPLMRAHQKQFGREAADAMALALSSAPVGLHAAV